MKTTKALQRLIQTAIDKTQFVSVNDYVNFCKRFQDFVAKGLQATIVSQNENHYRFFQFKEDGNFNITRPINSKLFYGIENMSRVDELAKLIQSAGDVGVEDSENRVVIQNSIYTLQQSIGATLDALPAGQSNTARKINGDLFERLIQLLINLSGVDCRSGTIEVPIIVSGEEVGRMSYQHDLLIYFEESLKVIGSVKTSSKDRFNKIFADKFMYERLTETEIPHIAIFLNDVQRKQTGRENRYGVSATFLPGHFKAYSVKLSPLNGVYYCDIRPNMQTDKFLSKHIQTIDHFFCEDLKLFRSSGNQK